MKHCLTSGFFKLEETIIDEVLLMQLVEGEHPWRSELDVGGKNNLHPIDQEEWSLPVGLVALVRMDHKTDWRLSNHFLPQDSSLALKLLVFRPLRTSAFARLACPLLLG
jgi:hypothetical protein